MSNVLSITGLSAQAVAPVAEGLKTLLASLQVYYTNLRGYHWHVRGNAFYQLHKQYEEMYDDAAEKIDEVAERLLQLGVQPENRYSALIPTSLIKETTLESKPESILAHLIEAYTILIKLEREILEKASEIGDETTVALLSDFIAGQEKEAWMLDAIRG